MTRMMGTKRLAGLIAAAAVLGVCATLAWAALSQPRLVAAADLELIRGGVCYVVDFSFACDSANDHCSPTGPGGTYQWIHYLDQWIRNVVTEDPNGWPLDEDEWDCFETWNCGWDSTCDDPFQNCTYSTTWPMTEWWPGSGSC